MVLQYRSKRRGFIYYVQGCFIEFAKVLYKLPVQVKVTKQEVLFDTLIVTYDLHFDNSAYKGWAERQVMRKEQGLPIKAGTLFEMFPFCILFHEDLTVSCLGVALRQVIPGLAGKKVTAFFELVKPMIDFKFENIRTRANNMFELATTEEVNKLGGSSKTSSGGNNFSDEINLEDVRLLVPYSPWFHAKYTISWAKCVFFINSIMYKQSFKREVGTGDTSMFCISSNNGRKRRIITS